MKNIKKFLSTVLALSMAVSMSAYPVFARAEGEEIPQESIPMGAGRDEDAQEPMMGAGRDESAAASRVESMEKPEEPMMGAGRDESAAASRVESVEKPEEPMMGAGRDESAAASRVESVEKPEEPMMGAGRDEDRLSIEEQMEMALSQHPSDEGYKARAIEKAAVAAAIEGSFQLYGSLVDSFVSNCLPFIR